MKILIFLKWQPILQIINHFLSLKYEIGWVKSQFMDVETLKRLKAENCFIFISNFIQLSYDCKEELEKIDILINILEKRRDNLFKTLEIFKNKN